MFNLFDKYKKHKKSPIEIDFDKVKRDYASIATSQLYDLFVDYFEAKIEINRDVLENSKNSSEIAQKQAEITVMREFISDIENMRENLRTDS